MWAYLNSKKASQTLLSVASRLQAWKVSMAQARFSSSLLLCALAPALSLSLLICCRPSRVTQGDEAGGRISLTYWSATNAQELEFANGVAAEWNRQHPEVQI